MESLWKIEDVCNYLGCKPNTIYRLKREDPKFPAHTLGKKMLRFVPDEIRAWASASAQ